jgi:hypothetical protein
MSAKYIPLCPFLVANCSWLICFGPKKDKHHTAQQFLFPAFEVEDCILKLIYMFIEVRN